VVDRSGGSPPRYLAIDGPGNLYWNWDGQTEVRVFLVFKNGDETIQQEFAFMRIKK